MQVIRLTPRHAAEYRTLMLQAYAQEPEAFTATVPEREPLPLAWWVSRVSDQPHSTEMVFGAFVDARLVGVAGLKLERRERTKHKASLFGMAVQPSFRGQGIGRALVEAVLKQARSMPGTRVVQLRVAESNAAARQLYASCGFQPYGIEPLANKIGARYVSIVHMWCAVDQEVS